MTKLKERTLTGLRWTEYELLPTGVKVSEKNSAGIHETLIDYDRIGHHAGRRQVTSPMAKWCAVFFGVLTLFCLFAYLAEGDVEASASLLWFAFLLVSLAYYFGTKRDGVGLVSDYSSLYIGGKREDRRHFLKVLFLQKNDYILKNASKRLAVIEPFEVERYLLGLRQGGVLNDSDYDELRGKLGFGQKRHPGF